MNSYRVECSKSTRPALRLTPLCVFAIYLGLPKAIFAQPVVEARALSDSRPNILLIVADDLGHHDVGFNGLREFETPNLDTLATSGVICRNGYACHPFCAPSRAGLLTGRYQHRFGFEGNPLPGNEEQGLAPQEKTLADYLRAGGYETVGIGKWHLGEAAKYHPLRRGFQSFFGFLRGSRSYLKTDNIVWETLDQRDEIVTNAPHVDSRSDYLTDLLTDEAMQFIKRPREKPFFMYLAYSAPHTPLQATPIWLEKVSEIKDKGRQTYAAMVTSMDDGIGRIRSALNSSGNSNTLIFFMSDNGGITPVNTARNDPFRGFKGTLLEGGIRVPFVVHWEGHLQTNSNFVPPVIGLDAVATTLAAAQLSPPRDTNLDSVNLLPYLKGQQTGPVHRALYWRCGNGFQLAARRGNQKYLHVDGVDDRSFNLKTDPQESVPRRHFVELRKLAEEWSESLPKTDFTALGTRHPEQWEVLGLIRAPKREKSN